MILSFVLLLYLTSSATLAYYSPNDKEAFLSQIFLREVFDRMGKGNYFDDFLAPSRSVGDLEDERQLISPLNYARIHPSTRDREFLQHSSLWGGQAMSGGAGEGRQLLTPEGNVDNKIEIKTDSALPAYCNPPNPCPLGYSNENGCIEQFENTASFSRKYQAAQDNCMCDIEHMFDCPEPLLSSSDSIDTFGTLELNKYLQRTIVDKKANDLQHKIVAKKYYLGKKNRRENPFLMGERLPVAAKKGNNVVF